MNLSELLPVAANVLIAFISGGLGGLLTFFVSWRKAKNEFTQWKSEFDQKLRSEDDAQFEEMIRLCYQQFDTRRVDSRAVSLISLARSRASGPYAEALDELYDVIALDQCVLIPGAIERVAAARKAEDLV